MNGYTGGADVVERAGAKNCFSKLIDSDRGLARVSEYLMFFFCFLKVIQYIRIVNITIILISYFLHL